MNDDIWEVPDHAFCYIVVFAVFIVLIILCLLFLYSTLVEFCDFLNNLLNIVELNFTYNSSEIALQKALLKS